MAKSVKIQKAIFPVGGLGTRFLPASKSIPKELFPIAGKPLIHWAVEEAAAAGCTEFIFVRAPHKPCFIEYFERNHLLEDELRRRGKQDALDALSIAVPADARFYEVIQEVPQGLGDAILSARAHVDDAPFAVILPDDLILGRQPCLALMVAQYCGGNLLAIEKVARARTANYGVIKPHDSKTDSLISVAGLVEKPSPEKAPSDLAIVGRYILDPQVISALLTITPGAGGEYQLTDALATFINTMSSDLATYAMPIDGCRYDCGTPEGYTGAMLAYTLSPFAANMDIKAELLKIIGDVTNNTPLNSDPAT